MGLAGENRGIVLTVSAAAAITVTSAAILLRRRHLERKSKEDKALRERYLPALQELTRKFFHISRDVAEVAKRVRKNVQEKGLEDQVTDLALRQQLKVQCKILEKLEEAQEEVATAHKCSTDDLRNAQNQLACRDREVQALAESYQVMLDDALSGEEPIMPGISIATDEGKQKIVLDLYTQVHTLARRKVYEYIAKSQSLTMHQLVPVMQDCHNNAVSEVLGKCANKLEDLLSPRSDPGAATAVEIYYSALSVCSRIPTFVAKKEKEDENFKQKMKEMLSLNPGPTSPNGTNGKKS
eukprot:gnl/MRDRNA2_/MRDRNA2_107851_c0_seq1.p1 gnl/MRDRNA2_/MRDRNA2_107851_c0~~gnl/MRDRNA2_/MRDRNA2_107851_c0_seq1.p1  ORF type:complete len:296 (+),score=74.40 gnl/MRDRNA2_/MRDRNA2_107851_c0_seq1:79-966(+)